MPAISTTLMPIARPAPSSPYNLNAANTVSSKPPMAPPCNASAKPGRCSRCFQPRTRPASASTLMPASRSSIGMRIQPWSLAYFNSDATPASNTSMPTLTGTLPSVNQRFTALAARASGPGPDGTSCACCSNSAGAAARGGAWTALRAVADAGTCAGNDGGIGLGIGATGDGAACTSAAAGRSGAPDPDRPRSDASCAPMYRLATALGCAPPPRPRRLRRWPAIAQAAVPAHPRAAAGRRSTPGQSPTLPAPQAATAPPTRSSFPTHNP